MALFNRKKTNTVANEESMAMPGASLAHILKHPRITEKASMHQSMSVYVFDVAVEANKRQIARAVEQYYKVRPRMVRIVSVPKKRTRNMRTGTTGATKRGKKAYVYLKKGETITTT